MIFWKRKRDRREPSLVKQLELLEDRVVTLMTALHAERSGHTFWKERAAEYERFLWAAARTQGVLLASQAALHAHHQRCTLSVYQDMADKMTMIRAEEP